MNVLSMSFLILKHFNQIGTLLEFDIVTKRNNKPDENTEGRYNFIQSGCDGNSS